MIWPARAPDGLIGPISNYLASKFPRPGNSPFNYGKSFAARMIRSAIAIACAMCSVSTHRSEVSSCVTHLRQQIGHAKPSRPNPRNHRALKDFASMRRAFLLFVKAAISILLLYFSLRWGNISAIGDRLSHLQPGWIIFGLGLLATQIILLTFRWRTIAVASGAKLAFAPAFQFTFI